MIEPVNDHLAKFQGMMVGLAIGDSLGMVLEFKQRGSFKEITGLESGGPFNLPKGYWTDDTSMALCLADSILARKGYDSLDVMNRYTKWHDEGYRSSTGACFDVGNQVAAAISSFKQNPEVSMETERTTSAGNGSIMRLAPVVIASMAANNTLETTMRLARVSARETHYSLEAERATSLFAGMLYNAVNAKSKHTVLEAVEDSIGLLPKLEEVVSKDASEIKPTGYVIDTILTAYWAFMTTENFKDGALKAVNLGGDSDTIGAVYGQLAGAYYGISSIPADWLHDLFQHEEIKDLAMQLSKMDRFTVIGSRFREDRFGGPGDPVRALGHPEIDAVT